MKSGFFEDGYAVYDPDPQLKLWADAAMPLAEQAMQDPQLIRDWLRCEGTWFVGVDALDTGPNGEAGHAPLAGQVIDDLRNYVSFSHPLHKAQLSAVFPGYPKPREGESETAFAYRLNRDAAHVDGLHPIGEMRRRHLTESHAFLLGIGLTDCSPDASPLVVWKGSHRIMADAFYKAFKDIDPGEWSAVDLTDAYHAARRICFDQCTRVELPVKPGQAVVMHRHVLHGIAPWGQNAHAPNKGRMTAYFRPEISGASGAWLTAD